ncbi:FAD-binding oxidoreductase [Chitinimonas lacunae]|uniref:FAD-binding oxidoreductase n=1 Tax=Chitinimonas lacunae TaxID=1963018 RepID=A0ABV8MV71_9NEIS
MSLSCLEDIEVFGIEIKPASSRYAEVVRPYNEAARPAQPQRIFAPRELAHIQAIIQFARSEGLKLSVHSTGHDFEGRSLDGDIIMHMGAFNTVSYDPASETVTVGGGARIEDIYRVLAPHGRAITTGTNLDVGITGLALGGGAAYTSRLYGLTCDLLLEVTLCGFNGEVIQVNDDSAPQLMRLLRGAGAGVFGVVTQLKFKTYAAAPVTIFRATWPASLGGQHLAQLESILLAAPRELSMRVGTNVTGADPVGVITLSGQLQGAREAEIERAFGPLCHGSNWTQSTIGYYDAMVSARHQTSGGAFKIKSRFAMQAIGASGLHELLDHVMSWTPTSNEDGAGFGLFAWGGAVRDFPSERSFMPARNAEYLASFDTSWTARESETEIIEQLKWLDEMDRIGARYLSNIAYLNFPDSDDGRFFERHFPAEYEQYETLRSQFDPDGLVRQISRCINI